MIKYLANTTLVLESIELLGISARDGQVKRGRAPQPSSMVPFSTEGHAAESGYRVGRKITLRKTTGSLVL